VSFQRLAFSPFPIQCMTRAYFGADEACVVSGVGFLTTSKA